MKIKAFQQNPENVDSRMYLDFEGTFIIDGNSDFISRYNDYDLYTLIQKLCVEYMGLYDSIIEFDNNDSAYKNVSEIIQNYLEFTPDKKQVHDIKAALKKADDDYPATDFEQLTCDLLTICEKRQWTFKLIMGECQGEWQYIYYPKDEYDDDFIKYIEAAYFNTGDEYYIQKSDDNDTDNEPDYNADGYCDYFSSCSTEELKEQIASTNGCTPDDVSIYEHHTVTSSMWELI